MIAENLSKIHAEIARVAVFSNRQPEEVTLIAVSKTYPVAAIREAYAAGQRDFGENRPQELAEKHALLENELLEIRWHMIGGLQRNKVKYIAPFVDLIHSVDSEKLLVEINKQAEKAGRVIPCLLQINISNEMQKGGFKETEAGLILQNIHHFTNVRIEGLMGMAEFTGDRDLISSQFSVLNQAFENFRAYQGPQINMRSLSMGMSGDFDLAIARGATMIRIGTAIFGNR